VDAARLKCLAAAAYPAVIAYLSLLSYLLGSPLTLISHISLVD